MSPSVCVVLHDVAAATLPACERVIAAVGQVGPVSLTLLAVPRHHLAPSPPAFGTWLADRCSAGDEVALHGYTHQDEGTPHGLLDFIRRRHYTRGEGEFCDLSMPEATRRITAGMRWLARHGITPEGFVAPAWLMSEGTWEALRWTPVHYTCTLRRLVLLPERRALASQAIVYSSETAWRRQASVALARVLAPQLRDKPLMRLELHPQDADHPAILRSWQGLLERALERRRAHTLAQVAQQYRRATDWESLVNGDTVDAA